MGNILEAIYVGQSHAYAHLVPYQGPDCDTCTAYNPNCELRAGCSKSPSELTYEEYLWDEAERLNDLARVGGV